MSKKKKGRGITALIVILAIAALAVAALIIWKRLEYNAGKAFYDGLRGAFDMGGAGI